MSHCNDACAFHGDASASDIALATEATKCAWMEEYHLGEKRWLEITTDYHPGCDSALYKFVCVHCGVTLFGWDIS